MTIASLLLATTASHSALESAGRGAATIERLWWVFFWVSAGVYLLVLIALAVALLRRRSEPGPDPERSALRVVATATGVTVLTMFALLVASILTGRTLAGPSKPAVTIELTGHQWWWQVDYDDPVTSRRFATANEIFIPVGEPVRIKLRTTDVIHSFWVPSLNGKRDLITGHDGEIELLADRAGLYRGQCAEFCGAQHAKMAFQVSALPKQDYLRWAERQRQHAHAPANPIEAAGQKVFLQSSCPLCHTVGGTDAAGKNGPDLTHFGSRQSIAAGSLPNERGNLAAWITDPQHVKPGSFMPPTTIDSRDLAPLVTYLESLQ